MARQLWRFWLIGALLAGLMFLLVTAGAGFAMPPTHAVGIALGGGMGILPRGVEVVGHNPALLGLSDNPSSSMRLPLINLGLYVGNNSWSFSRVGDTFQEGKMLTRDEKQQLIDDIQDGYLATRMDMYIPAIGLSMPLREHWNLAISLDALSWGELRVDKDIYELGFMGQTRDDFGRRCNFDETYGESIAAGRAGFTFARNFDDWNYVQEYNWLSELAAGLTVSYYYGGVYGRTEEVTGGYFMDVDSIDAEGYVEVVTAQTGGHGYGLDFGLSAKVLNRKGTVGLGITNLLGSIGWGGADKRIYALEALNGIPIQGMDDFEQYWEENFSTVDSLQEDVSITSDLPSELILSGGWWLVQDFQLVGAVRQSLDQAPGTIDGTRIGGGVEWLLTRTKRLRAGAGFGGLRGPTCGIGYGTQGRMFKWDIGLSYERGLINSSTGFSFGLNMAWFFDQPERDPHRTKEFWQNKARDLRDDYHFFEPRTAHHAAPGEIAEDIASSVPEDLRKKLFLKDDEDDVRRIPVTFPGDDNKTHGAQSDNAGDKHDDK